VVTVDLTAATNFNFSGNSGSLTNVVTSKRTVEAV
jgi:hypothetical protein